MQDRRTQEDTPVRQKLLLELSSLRRHFAQIVGVNQHTGSDEIDADHAQEYVLDQSDRDAIEAFFRSDDDFTRQFNEGTGNIKRADLISLDLKG